MQRLFLAALVFVAGLAAGLILGGTVPHPRTPLPVAQSAPIPIPIATAPVDRCASELVSTKTQLAICLGFRPSPESSAAVPPVAPTAAPSESDALTEQLIRTNTANTEVVIVRTPTGGVRVYPPGTWPPADGPEPGARVMARMLPDGGREVYDEDGGSRVLPARSPDFVRCYRECADQ